MSVPEAFRLVTSDLPSAALATAENLSFLMPTNGAAVIGIVLANKGANGITATIEKTPLGHLFGTDTALGTQIATIAAGTNWLGQISAKGFETVRVTLNSPAGPSSFEVEAKGVF